MASVTSLKRLEDKIMLALDRNVKESALIVLGLTLGVPNIYFWKDNPANEELCFRDSVNIPNIRKSLEKVQIHELRHLLSKILLPSNNGNP